MAAQFYLKACHFQFFTQPGYTKACHRFKTINNIKFKKHTVEDIDRMKAIATRNLTYEQIIELP